MKTSICRAFQKGKCRDENCKFAHGEAELRVTDQVYKTQLCVFHARGFCKKGNRCRHAHGHQEMRQYATPQQWDQEEEVQPLQEQCYPVTPNASDRLYVQQHQEPLLKPVPEPGKNAAAAPWTPPPAMIKTPTHSMAKTPSTTGPLSFHSSMASLGSSPAPWELAEPRYVPLPEDLRFSSGRQLGHMDEETMFGKPFSFSNSGALRALCRDLTETMMPFEDDGVTQAAPSPNGSEISAPGSLSSAPDSVSYSSPMDQDVAPSTPPQTPRQVLPSASPMREAIETSLASIMDSPTPWHPTALRFEALSA